MPPIRHTLALVLVTSSAATLPAQKPVPEPRAGIAFVAPKGWVELPGDCERGATVRLLAAPSTLADKGEGKHMPLLRVMFFTSGGTADADVVDGLPRTTPFRGLEDFCKRGLGSKSVEATPQKVGGAEGQRIEGKDVPGGRVLIGQTITTADGEAAICVEVLANHAEKVKKELEPVFASIEPVARVALTRPQAPWRVDAEWAAKDATARAAARRKWAETVVAATTANPEPGCKVSKAKYWTVVSGADPAFTKKVVAAAEAGRDWLAKKMPELTKDAPMPAVLRVFDSIDQYNAYLTTRNNSREYDQIRRELLVANDRDNGGATGFGQVLRAVVWHLFDDFDDGILPGMPRWLDNGLWEFLRSSKFDGKKFEFFAGDVEKGRVDYYRQKDTPMPNLWDLMQEHMQPSPKEGAMEQNWGYTPECARLMRWFWMFDGQKAFDRPTLVTDYVRALGIAYWKAGPDPTADVQAVALTEAEQKERNTRYYKWRDNLLVGANNIAVPLQVDAWKALNVKWLEFNKTFK